MIVFPFGDGQGSSASRPCPSARQFNSQFGSPIQIPMKALILNSKWRWLTSLAAIALIGIAALFLSHASAGPELATVALPDNSVAVPAVRAPNLLAPAAPIYITGGFTFDAPKRLVRPPIPPTPGVTLLDQDIEPEIKIDIFGNIYVAAINGVPGGVDLWKSTDNGTTFVYLGHPDGTQEHCGDPPQPACVGGLGGADVSLDISNSGFLYVSSLSIASVTVSTSFDGGTGGVAPGQAWQVQPVGSEVPADDRQWIVAHGPETVYMTMRQAPGTSTLHFFKSTDAGKTFLPSVPITTIVSREANMAIDQYNGNIYSGYTSSGNPAQMNLLRSSDGGATWVASPVYDAGAGRTLENAFTILATDRGGNLHLVFAQSDGVTGRSNCHVYLMSTANPAAANPSWTAPIRVDAPPATGNSSAVMPWIVGGSPGTVDITWYQSSSASPDSAPFDWKVYFAQVTNALQANPTITAVQAVPGTVHDAAICARGTGCATGTRDLAEYYTVTLDPDGKAHIAFVDGIASHECTASNCRATTWYTKQTSGPSAYNPPAPPAPATFATNIGVGAPGAEPGIWVDSFNCIYVTAPGNPWVWKSVNKGASFLAPVNPVADEATLTGGDEDIISLPKLGAGAGTRPDQLYFTDLGLSTCHIRKSVDGGATWTKPGPGGSAGDVSVSADRQWLAGDQGYPTAADQIIYHWEHELASEAMRMSSLVNDTEWVSVIAMTDPELTDPQTNTLPNTNPGPIFVNKATHRVFALFNGSVPSTNAVDPPFGKLLNVWETDAAAPINAASPVTDIQNHLVFKGVYDSASNPPPAQGPPTGPTYGTNNANIFPAGDIDAAGNIYVAWSMNNSRTNEFSIWFASSHDHGKTFYGPFWVSTGPLAADETAVFPWVAAGDEGRVDIIWYGTNTVGDPNTLPGAASWKRYFAQTLNGNSREPVFTVVQPNPSNVIHTGQISTGGLIGSSDRSLLDFMEVAIGPDGMANVIYADNAGQGTRAEYTRQNGGPSAKANPNTTITCLPPPPGPPIPVSVVSRKTHGTSGTHDVNLPLTGTAGVECRTGGANGDHTVVITFAVPVTVSGATVSSSDGQATADPPVVTNQIVTVNLHKVANAQTLSLTLVGASDGTNSGNVVIPMSVLLGDTTANGSVNSSDISQTKSQSGQVVSSANFRTDVTVNGAINSSDISLVKSKSGTALPVP